MDPIETSGQEADRRPKLLERAGTVGCVVVAFVPIIIVIGLVAGMIASILHSQVHLSMWLSVLLGLAAAALFIAFLSVGNGTLVELSFTCAIFAILGAILFPVFRNARAKARRARQKAARSAVGTTRSARHADLPVSTSGGAQR